MSEAEWNERPWRYGLSIYDRSDGASVRPLLTSGGNTKWEARHPKAGLAASDRGYPTKFSSVNAAKAWLTKQDGRAILEAGGSHDG